MNFRESESYLYSLGNEVSAMKLGLENIRTLLTALGEPHKQYLKVQIAGTNGKGSVCAFLGSICREAGVKTGVFTSPHLVSITERVRIDGDDITETEFARFATIVRDTAEKLLSDEKLEYRPTFFEQMTAIGLIAFAEAKVELAILETGLGGRLDATTAANADIAVITRIDLDHQEYLGDTIEDIAAEKAAIIGPDTKAAIIGEQMPEAMSVLRARCRELCVTPTTECRSWVWALNMNRGSAVVGFQIDERFYDDADLGLIGRHQVENARTAVMIADILRSKWFSAISADAVTDGLESARHFGRLEYQDRFLFDGAHNPAGALALRAFLDESVEDPVTMIFAAMKGKDVTEIAETLFPSAARLILTQPGNSRAMTAAELAEYVPAGFDQTSAFQTATVADALDVARRITPDDGIILITGSLYLVGEVKKILNN
ncbi:MAG: bifunctional folylpolyglutamate synthase/dihydrofolate synthase [Pyrinomonadaceae bacterium]|nr:bifunctional folylpolyglutamate synthase/dihydrofolate synthase [Pyrinomonadaceae bacterium]MBP6213661.1 bifunctional folylpolyglutamate synthase/dihydrofolate synthase [Pyrinomonadaceae bacterium]